MDEWIDHSASFIADHFFLKGVEAFYFTIHDYYLALIAVKFGEFKYFDE